MKKKKIRKAGDVRTERKRWGKWRGKKVGEKDLTIYLKRQVLFLWPLESIILSQGKMGIGTRKGYEASKPFCFFGVM